MDAANENGGGSSPGGGAGGSSSRWNPTKEQLSMLEGLYGQGIRTPSAEQIQSITKKLQVYGHIEGKNVFYWFQNHKARQRQKQKMDQMASANNNIDVNSLNNNSNAAYFNRCYYPPPPPVSLSFARPSGGVSHPLFQAAHHNVAYSPYYVAQPEFGSYPNRPKMVLPHHLVNNSQTSNNVIQNFRRENIMKTRSCHNADDNVRTTKGGSAHHSSNGFGEDIGQVVTLDLFPLHPTGILRDRNRQSLCIGSSSESSLEEAAGSDQERSPEVQTSLSPSSVGFHLSPKMA